MSLSPTRFTSLTPIPCPPTLSSCPNHKEKKVKEERKEKEGMKTKKYLGKGLSQCALGAQFNLFQLG